MALEPHVAVRDGDTDYCARCPLPLTNRVHVAPQASHEPILAPVDEPQARVSLNHPSTSHQAAAKALPRSGTIKAAIFAIIANKAQGATDDELEMILGRTHQSVSASRNSLMNDGWIEPLVDDQGRHVVRRTRSGNDAYAWTATVAARTRMGAAA